MGNGKSAPTPSFMYHGSRMGWAISRGYVGPITRYHDFEGPGAEIQGYSGYWFIDDDFAEASAWEICDHGNPTRCHKHYGTWTFQCYCAWASTHGATNGHWSNTMAGIMAGQSCP